MVEFVTHGAPCIVDQFRQELVAIGWTSEVNITETNASITFLVVYRNDSGTYDFIVHND